MRALVIFLALCALASAYPKSDKKSNKATYSNDGTQFKFFDDYIDPDVNKVQSGKQGRRQFTTESNEDGSGDYNNDDNEESNEVSVDDYPSVKLIRRNLEPSGKYIDEEYSDGEVETKATGEPIAMPYSNDKSKIRLLNQPKHTNYPQRHQESDKKSNRATYSNDGTQFEFVDDYIDPDVNKIQSGKQGWLLKERRRSIKESNEKTNDDSNKSQSRKYDDESNYKTERPWDLKQKKEDSYYEDFIDLTK